MTRPAEACPRAALSAIVTGLAILFMAPTANAIQIAGELLMDFEASGFNQGTGVWTNNDTTGLTYGNFTGSGPTSASVFGVNAVTFNNQRMNTSVNSTGFGVTGNDSWSAEMWVLNPSIANEEAILGWAPRNIGTSQTAHVGYGSNGAFGAAVHWGNDIGFGAVPLANTWHHVAYTFDGTTERVYVDGAQTNSKNTTLNIAAGYTATLGAAGTGGGNTGVNLPFSGSLNRVRFHTDTLSAADVLSNYNAEKSLFPQSYIAAASGNWSTGANWSPTAPAGGPTGYDTVTIPGSGRAVDYDAGASGTVGYINMGNSGGGSTLTLQRDLAVAELVNMTGSGNANNIVLDLNGHQLSATTLQLRSGGQANLLPTINRGGGGTINVGTLDIQNGQGAYALNAGDVIGNLIVAGSGAQVNGIDITTAATSNITTSVYVGWHYINELKLGAPLNISGDMTLERGSLITNGNNVTVGGNWFHGTGQGGTFNRAGGGTLTLNGNLTPGWNTSGGGIFPTLPGDVFNGTVGFGWVQTNANSFLDMNQSAGQTTGITVNGSITDQVWDRGQYAIRLFFDNATTGNGTDWGLRWAGDHVSTLTTWDNRSDAANVGDLTLQYSGVPRGADVSIWYDSNDNYTYVGYTANFRSWANAGSGAWENSGDWSPAIVPDSISVATIGNGGTAQVTAPGAQAQTVLLDLGTVNVNAGGSLNVGNRIEVAATGNLVSTGSLSTPLIETAGNTTLTGSGSISTVNVNAGITTLGGGASGNIGTVNANGGTANLAGVTVDTLNVLGSTVNVQAPSTAATFLVNSPGADVQISGGDLTTSNGQITNGLVATSGGHALVVADGGQLKVGSDITINAAGATANVRGTNILNPTAGAHNTLSLVGGTVTITGALGAAGAAADMTNVKHQWEFNDSTDSRGTASDGVLSGNATISGGQLHMSGSNGNNRMLATLNSALGYNKTLMAWFTLDSLTPNNTAGGPLGVQNSAASLFDSIVYGERTAGQWMAGSDYWRRTPVNNGGAAETVAGQEIMMAITYDSTAQKITLYRNGTQYAQYTQSSNLQTYDAAAQAIFGPRVATAGYFNGAINEARIYDTPLTGTQIADIFNSFYSPLDINMPYWDIEVNHTTTLSLDTTADVVLGDLIINLGAHSPPDTILEILSGASSISWANLIINGPAAAGTYVLVDWSDMLGTSDPFFDGMFGSVTMNGVAGTLSYFDDQIVFQAQAEAVPEPNTLALAALGLVGLVALTCRARAWGAKKQ